jgi:hypothetical protein
VRTTTACAHAGAERSIGAAPATVYGVLADYRTHHPQIMPPALFADLEVEQGGTGAGTVFRISVRAPGRNRRLHMRVDEPDPGRVLTETDLDTGVVTTFSVTPQGHGSLARISSEWVTSSGLRGLADQLVKPALTRLVFQGQLHRLARCATSQDLRPIR